jgi:hypothetical protein
MTIAIKIPGASFTASGVTPAIFLKEGFTESSLKSLYLMADTAPATLIVDAMGNANSVLQQTANQNTGYSVLSNGGLRMRGLTRFLGPQIDFYQPYTLFFAGRINVPDQYTGSGWIQATLSTEQYNGFQRGFMLYSSRGSAPVDGDTISTLFRPTNKGAQDTTNTRTVPAATAIKYGAHNLVMALRHSGGGTFNLRYYAGTLAAVNFDTTLPYPQIITNSSNVVDSNMRPALGMISDATWQSTDLNVETFAVWTKSLSEAELSINVAKAFALIAARGR